jgi:hypothetical protein
MSKFSSFKESKMLFENWRQHLNEAEMTAKVAQGLGDYSRYSDEEKASFKNAITGGSMDDEAAMQEQQVDANMSPDEKTQKMLEILRSMNNDDSECFNKALHALGEFTSGQGAL